MSLQSTILVVDDDPDVREIVVETLMEFGYDVRQAQSGEEALPMLDRHPEIGVLITDVRMPGMSGLDLAAEVERQHAGVRVIVVSGYFVAEPVTQRFLRKPFHMRELASAVAAEMAR